MSCFRVEFHKPGTLRGRFSLLQPHTPERLRLTTQTGRGTLYTLITGLRRVFSDAYGQGKPACHHVAGNRRLKPAPPCPECLRAGTAKTKSETMYETKPDRIVCLQPASEKRFLCIIIVDLVHKLCSERSRPGIGYDVKSRSYEA